MLNYLERTASLGSIENLPLSLEYFIKQEAVLCCIIYLSFKVKTYCVTGRKNLFVLRRYYQ